MQHLFARGIHLLEVNCNFPLYFVLSYKDVDREILRGREEAIERQRPRNSTSETLLYNSGGLTNALVTHPESHLKGALAALHALKGEDLFGRNKHFRKNAYF